MSNKIVVKVITEHDEQDNITPLAIIWSDGRKFEIDRVLEEKRRASLKAGGQGMRYTIQLYGKRRYLWHDTGEGNWFVESG